MSMTKRNTVLVHKVVGQEFEEAVAASDMRPGNLVQITGKVVGGFTATLNAVRGFPCHVVTEEVNTFQGKTVRDQVDSGDTVVCAHLQPGVKFTGLLKDTVADVEVGDILIADETGHLDHPAEAVAAVQSESSPYAVSKFPVAAELMTARQLYRAEEACVGNNTYAGTGAGSGDDRRIICRVL